MIAPQLAQAREFEAIDLIEQVDLFRLDANRQLDSRRRVELGQFMTPAPIACLMASMLVCDTSEVSLLDAGAGVGSLLSAAVVALSSRDQPPKSIRVTAYELEPLMIAYLRDTLQLCAELCDRIGIAFSSEIIAADFIAHTVDLLANPLFEQSRSEYSCAILNPPYRKIQTASATRRQLSRVGIETSNLYTAFLALAAHLLAKDGELVAITPRSYCNGPYFRPFRKFFLQTMALRQFHLFDSRQQAFRHDQVLQENIIVSARKSQMRSHTVLITSSIDSEDEMPTMHEMEYTDVVRPSDPQLFIHLLADHANAQVATRAATLSARLMDLGLEISTGRVVDFRASLFLRSEPTSDTVPLLYPAHMTSGRIEWPKPSSKKPNALVLCDATKDLFVPNEYYVLLKRFSSKEERRRVVAAVYDPTHIPGPVVGFENHLNYFHHHGRGIDVTLACGLAAFLNSTLVDDYFRQFSGHTQVNATDLRMMRFPTLAQLLALGRRIGTTFPAQEELDELVAQECVAMSEVSGLDTIRRNKRVEEALAIRGDIPWPD
jgi:adenine-specific DNA-methyltransferase